MSSRNDQQLQSQTSSHKRSKNSFSNVNSDALESVISFLPIKEATKLSILSKRFRHSWKYCRNLCFDRSVIQRMSNDEIKTLINNFFQQHMLLKADKFSLRFDPTGEEVQQVYEWVRKAVALGVTEFELDLRRSANNDVRFPIDHHLIGRNVEKLKLVGCEIHFSVNPNSVNGYFPHLRELTLQHTSLSRASIRSVLVSCPSLSSLHLMSSSFVDFHITISARNLKWFQKLVVHRCSDIDSITIDAPHLNTFHYHGKMIEFILQNGMLTRLNDVVLDVDPWRGFALIPCRNDVMKAISCVRVLSLSSAFLEGLSSRYEEDGEAGWGSSILRLWRLKELNLDVTKESFIAPNDIVEFIKKCRDIETLTINLRKNTFKMSRHWDVHGRRYMNENTINLPRLKSIKITGFIYKELHVTMARYFIKNVQHLRDLIIVRAKNHNFPEEFAPNRLGQGLLQSSSTVNIQVIEHRKDEAQ